MGGLTKRRLQPVQSRPDVALAEPKRLSDFAVSVAFEMQQQQGSIYFRLTLQERAELPELLGDHRILIRCRLQVTVETELYFALLAPLAVRIDRDIQRDAINPGRELAGRVVISGCRQQSNHDLLEKVFPFIRRVGIRPADLVNQALVRIQHRQKPFVID